MDSKQLILSPSLLSCPFDKIGWGIDTIKKSGAPWVHFDVMDGVFVPPITFGAQMVKNCRPLCDLFYDVHLMVVNPENQIKQFIDAGANSITFHYEAKPDFIPLIQDIKDYNSDVKVGVAINPDTCVEFIGNGLTKLDMVLVMSVFPGYAGQRFIFNSVEKVKKLVEMRNRRGLSFLISVDGGIDIAIANLLRNVGADVVISGNSFFAYDDKEHFVTSIKDGVNHG